MSLLDIYFKFYMISWQVYIYNTFWKGNNFDFFVAWFKENQPFDAKELKYQLTAFIQFSCCKSV